MEGYDSNHGALHNCRATAPRAATQKEKVAARRDFNEEENVRRGNRMPKSTRNTGKDWSKTDVSQLRTLAKQNTPTRVIGLKLGRTANSV